MEASTQDMPILTYIIHMQEPTAMVDTVIQVTAEDFMVAIKDMRQI